MDTDATRALIEELLDAYNEPDLDRAALLYAEDCRYLNRALDIRIEGRDAQRANMQAFLDRFRPGRATHRRRRTLATRPKAAYTHEGREG